LIDSISLTPANDKLEIELRGDLAGILAVSQTAKTKASSKEKALQIKVVAGACNHRQFVLPPVPI
jgi:site-specific DNA recombinase